MKVIDLVNKIYNNEIRDNTKIKFINEPSATIWEYKTNFNTLSCGIMNKDLLMCLDDEIEIIEEEKKIELPEELKEILIPSSLSDSDDFRFIFNYINDLIKNQKQIVDYL